MFDFGSGTIAIAHAPHVRRIVARNMSAHMRQTGLENLQSDLEAGGFSIDFAREPAIGEAAFPIARKPGEGSASGLLDDDVRKRPELILIWRIMAPWKLLLRQFC